MDFDTARTIAAALEPYQKAIDYLQEAVRDLFENYGSRLVLVSLGIDLRDYTHFRSLTPIVIGIPGGQPSCQWMVSSSHNIVDAQWCIDFVIDFMLRVESGRITPSRSQPLASLDDFPPEL